ncbi:MAG: hypothetical protein WA705_21340 [Candidatus Ozemobacteraceae bacterium]
MSTPHATKSAIPIPATIPRGARKLFVLLADPLSLTRIPSIKTELDAYLIKVRAFPIEQRKFDPVLVEHMGRVCYELLTIYSDLSEPHRALSIGAIRYFITENDAHEDLADPMGFDDDLAVLNAVVTDIGREDLAIIR